MSSPTTILLVIAAVAANVFLFLTVIMWIRSRRREEHDTYLKSLHSIEERLRKDEQLDPEERERLMRQIADAKQRLAQQERPEEQQERPEELTFKWYQWGTFVTALVALVTLFAYFAQLLHPIGIIAWIVLALIAGVLAKLIMPGPDPGGIIVTILLGVIGGFLGNFIGQTLGFEGVTGLNLSSILWAVVGSIILLAIYRVLAGRRV